MTTEKLKIELLGVRGQASRVPWRISDVFARWRARARGRDVLAHLDALTRQDLGLTEADVWRETKKPPWQA